MNPLLKFLAAARSLASQGFKKEQIYDFAVREFGEVNPLMQKQIDNIFKPQKPITPKDPDFDNTVQKLGIDDQGKPFNPKDPLNNMATGGRAGYVEGGPIHPRLGELSSGVSSAEEQLQQINQSLQTAETSLGESGPGGAGSVTPSVNGYESSGSSLYNESPAGEVSNPYQAPVGMDPLQTPSTFMGKGGPEAFDNVPGAFNLKQNPYGNGNAMPATPIAVDSPSLTQTEDPARQAYADAQKSAQEIRAGGMMGQVVLPGEMNFEDFSNSGFNSFKPSGKLPSVGGGIGGLLGEGGGQQSTILPDENTAVTQGPGTGNSPPVYNSRPKLIDNTPEFKKSSDPIMGGFQESDFFKNMMGRPSTMDVQNYTLDGKEMSGSGTYFGGLSKYLESIGKGDLLQRNNNVFGNAGPLQSLAQGPGAPGQNKFGLAQGGRAGYYMGGQAMVGEDLSDIGHGSDSLMARNMQLSPGSQATTSTGLNYLLGQDNDTVRVPYKDGGKGMNRRGFLGLLGGLGAGIAGLKSGILGFGGKKAATEVATTTSSGGVPPYFLKLVAKIKSLGDDVTQTQSLAERQTVKRYKDFELTEDTATGKIEIQRYKVSDEASYYGQPLSEETYMSYSPGETIIGKGNKPVKTQPEYQEGTTFVRNDRGYTGEVVDESTTISDDIFIEVGEEVPEAIRKTKAGDIISKDKPGELADGGRAGYKLGKKVLPVVKEGIETLKNKVNEAFGKKVITTADQISRPTDALKRDMFTEANERLNKPTIPENIDLPVQQEGKFTKAEYLIQRLENTIKESPDDKYVKETFPNFIKELKDNPELAKNENVFKELGGDLPEGQQIVVYGDDSVDFFTQKSGPGNIDRLKKLMEKHNISREKALKIMKMEPNDQVMELKMLEVANRKLNSEGGRIGLLSGGGILKAVLKNSADAKGMTVRDFIMAMNPKSIPSNIKNLISKVDLEQLQAGYKSYYENIADMMKTRFDFQKNVEIGKGTPVESLFKNLEKTMDEQSYVPKNVTQDDIAKTELMIKNKFFGKGRKANATGGLATMLGE